MHKTHERPPTEPYAFHKSRQKAQQLELKEYLKGTPFWRSMLLAPVMKGDMQVVVKRIALQGTYKAPRCMFCELKDKHCKCLENI